MDISNGYTIKKVEKYISSLNELRLVGTNIVEDNTQKLILKVIEAVQNKHTKDIVTNEVQCMSGKRRSFVDLYRLCKYYKEDLDINDFINELNLLVKNNVIASYNCGVIRKRVYHFAGDRLVLATNGSITADGEYNDEFGWMWDAKRNNPLVHGGTHITKRRLIYGEEI